MSEPPSRLQRPPSQVLKPREGSSQRESSSQGSASGGGAEKSKSRIVKKLEKQAKEWAILGRKISSKYRVVECLDESSSSGSMSSSTLWAATSVSGGAPVTLRISKRSAVNIRQLTREVALLEQLEHPNIVRVIDAFLTRKEVIIVCEPFSGTTLMEGLQQMSENVFREDVIAWVVFQILRALQYCHSRGISHRDLRPCNIIFSADNPSNPSSIQIKLIDSGWASFISLDQSATLAPKNIVYAAPEVLTLAVEPEHHCKADSWSLGVVLFELLSGSLPWADHQVTSIAMEGPDLDALFDAPFWQNTASDAAVSFLRALLTHSPARRASASQALDHRWITMFNRGQEWIYQEGGAVLKQAFQSIAFRGPNRRSSGPLKARHHRDTSIPDWQSLFLQPAEDDDAARGSTHRLIIAEPRSPWPSPLNACSPAASLSSSPFPSHSALPSSISFSSPIPSLSTEPPFPGLSLELSLLNQPTEQPTTKTPTPTTPTTPTGTNFVIPRLDISKAQSLSILDSPFTARLFDAAIKRDDIDLETLNRTIAQLDLACAADDDDELVQATSPLFRSEEDSKCVWQPHVWYAPLGREICRNCFLTRVDHDLKNSS